jgi:hypothetical protein
MAVALIELRGALAALLSLSPALTHPRPPLHPPAPRPPLPPYFSYMSGEKVVAPLREEAN